MTCTIDELARAAGSTTRSIRSFQTLGLLEHPELRGRTGIYDSEHLQRLRSILRLQAEGFSLQSLAVLLGAYARGESLADVLGLASRGTPDSGPDHGDDEAERYGFAELQRASVSRLSRGRPGRPLLSVVPSTMWDQTEAS